MSIMPPRPTPTVAVMRDGRPRQSPVAALRARWPDPPSAGYIEDGTLLIISSIF